MFNHWIVMQVAKEHQADLMREAEQARRGQPLKKDSRLSSLVQNIRVVVMSLS